MQILKLKNLSFLLIICASVLIVMSCGEDEDPPTDPTGCETENLTYDNWANEYIDGTCATSGCHDASFADNMVPFGLHDYTSAKAAVDFGRIIGAIKRESGFSPMPKGGEMVSDCDISKMEAWIADGAPE